ncbi:SRPBCC family protein [Streptomyces sp. NPDC101234]|uniref:SRPBCC family protein n=1 Tax=Streptomyces sp. NPDC101234 TaxID=3366138 RepID=UPI003818C3B1
MAHTVAASAEHTIDAPSDEVYRYLADMHLHARFLPAPFYDCQVVQGGVGTGSVIQVKIDFAGGAKVIRMKVTEPTPGRTLVLTDTNGSGLVTTYTLAPQGGQTLVKVAASFDGESGVAGFVERIAAPRRLHSIYTKELGAFDAHAREQRAR